MKIFARLVSIFVLIQWIKSMTVDLTFERFHFSNKTDKAVLDFKDVSLKKFNRTHKMITGTFELLVDANNDYLLAVEIYKLQGNEYRKTPFKYAYKGVCDFLAGEKMFYPAVIESSNLPPQDTCPIPKGTYKIDNYFIDVSNVPPNFDGKYRIRILERHLEEFIDEASIWAEIVHYLN